MVRPVPVQPADYEIHCPGTITVILEQGETELDAADPVVATQLDSAWISGGCGAAPPWSHDAPATFPIGETLVTYTAEGADPCITRVVVALPAQLATIEGDVVRLRHVGGDVAFERAFTEPAHIDFDGLGQYLAVAENMAGRRVALIDPDTGIDQAEQLGFPTLDEPFVRSLDMRTQGALGYAVTQVGELRAIGVGLAGQHDVPGPTFVDFSDDGNQLLALATTALLSGGLELDVLLADVTQPGLSFEVLGNIAVAGEPRDLLLQSVAEGFTRFQLATTEGLFAFTHDAQTGELEPAGSYVRPIFDLQFPDGGTPAAAVSWMDGALGVLHDIGTADLPLTPTAYYRVALSTQHELMAVARADVGDVLIYRWTVDMADFSFSFSLLTSFQATDVRALRFRPDPD